ncbi:uncharacterized protein BXZ73DRAFT_102094 [Epithele typhae]|uniref:uncharacterized protein n=1 Tax=Epithele typhae TaxID=378194 RepID=UPI0020084F43|nr:uncharacterized protein BXZ73DRAFT_102094 [Epithele typhae]KAH9929565.1 hypothetical protein BXZ73DRAFT_102094 [Epithele typhae]
MTVMPSDPPSPTHAPRSGPHRTPTTPTTPRPALSPAQAIAQAWLRESAESQHQWRMADIRAKQKYLDPVRWSVAGPLPRKKREGAKM